MKIKRLFVIDKTDKELKDDFSKARKVAEVRLGADILFYRYFIRITALPYAVIQKAFLRIESGEVGEFPLTEHYLMLIDHSGTEHQFHMEHPEDAKEVLAFLSEYNPEIEIGYYKTRGGK